MREKIKLESSAGTGHFYTTTKNKRTTPDKLEIKKYDPKVRKHVVYKETKLKKLIWSKARKSPPKRAFVFPLPSAETVLRADHVGIDVLLVAAWELYAVTVCIKPYCPVLRNAKLSTGADARPPAAFLAGPEPRAIDIRADVGRAQLAEDRRVLANGQGESRNQCQIESAGRRMASAALETP